MKTKLLKLERSGKWWLGSKDAKSKWVTKRGEDYWVIPGSEFPEKKISTHSEGETPRRMEKSGGLKGKSRIYLYAIILSAMLGISLAINIISYLIK